MNKFKPIHPKYRIAKIAQLCISIFMLVLYIVFLALYSDSIAGLLQQPLFIAAQFIIWLLIIISILFSILDLTVFQKSIQERDSLKRSTYLDELTGMPNRLSCDLVFQMYGGETSKIEHVACALITISNLISINMNLGRSAGDQVLMDFCNMLEEIGEDYGFVGRNGGNEFLLVIENCNQKHMEDFFEQLQTRIKRYNVLQLNTPIEIKYKYVLNENLHANRFSNIITEVYNQLYKTNF